ncbi:penicillin-binding transpeptidase domain-containing protein [Megasphaera vaginalis (ex Bordigoni et al. 2020)]|uniref:penicillin-binding transpeptidase domain-containing protein n=1 Tax=Megasphaera vaginalis (ex Bordigoni et al. 2020) TaxID=2045301 RepID=UPI000C7A04B7|nr:penicillin-binding transpeptidase domain-containing protein [Megasphaera vaginalis (ex Bordigoni et al. 2020)]
MLLNTNDSHHKKIRKRISFCGRCLLIVCCLIAGRLGWLQIVQGGSLAERADAQTEEDRKLQSPRGMILDRDGKILAISEVTKSLYADPTMIEKTPAEMAKYIAPYSHFSEAELTERLSRDTAFVWLDRTMDHDKYKALEEVIRKENLKGLRFIDENRRYYPNGTLAAQLIGFVGDNDHGLDGIEMVLDKDIRGDIKNQRLTTDRNNIPILESALAQVLPDQERSVHLTIDTTIQFVAERGLDGIMKENRPEGAAIIVMNPKTGEILAMASRPNFDPNDFGKGSPAAYKNRAVVNLYEPGSTFKPIMAAAAVDSGKWGLHDTYDDVGYIDVDDRTIHNWDDAGMGKVTLKEILMYSINTGMANIGIHTGGKILTEYAKRFGFGKATGIELPGEGEGILFDPDKMSNIDEATMAIGQSIAVTPLQMVQAFGAIANRGHMMKPFVIREVDNPDGSVYKRTEPEEVGQPISEDVSRAISKIMAEEISSGGGQNAKIEGYQFCGKTGTAQRLNAEGTGYAEGQYIGSFIGFGPLEDPQYVVLIVVDNPNGTYYGAQVAAPVFKEMMTDIVRFKGVAPSGSIDSGNIPRDTEQKKTRTMPDVKTTDQGILLPSFIGWNNREVNDWLNRAGLGFVPNGSGNAVYQDPPAEAYAEPGSDVFVTFMR